MAEHIVPPPLGNGRWMIYRDDTPRWRAWWNFPYTIVGPRGSVYGVAWSRRSAMRALRLAQRQRRAGEQPQAVVHQEAADG